MSPDGSEPVARDRSPRVAQRERSVLLVIDLQESYRGKLYEEKRVVDACGRLIDASYALDVPIVVTEQYPERLGRTLDEIAARLRNAEKKPAVFPKRSFSCLGADGLLEHLQTLGRDQVIVAGIETHVCVSQTVHDLLETGYRPQVVRDAITARFALEDEAGFAKMVGSGAVPTSVECVLFEWLEDSRAAEFRAIHKLVV